MSAEEPYRCRSPLVFLGPVVPRQLLHLEVVVGASVVVHDVAVPACACGGIVDGSGLVAKGSAVVVHVLHFS